MLFPFSWNFIIPTDELIFFRGVGIPPNRDFLKVILYILLLHPLFICGIYEQKLVTSQIRIHSCVFTEHADV